VNRSSYTFLGPRDSNLVGGEVEMSWSQLYWRGGPNSRPELLPIKGFLYGSLGGALASPMADAVKREGFDPPLAAASQPTGEGVQL